MPANFRALVYVAILSGAAFLLSSRLRIDAVSPTDFKRYRNTWFAITIPLFLIGNFWIYVVVTALIFSVVSRFEPVKPVPYALLFAAAPTAFLTIPGFGLVNKLFDLSHQYLLALVGLAPILFGLIKVERLKANPLRLADILLVAYVTLSVLVSLRDSSLTHALRLAVHSSLGILLPYFAFSRLLVSFDAVRKCAFALMICMIALAIIGFFEAVRHWHVYGTVVDMWDASGWSGKYKSRAGLLRATTTAGGPIVYGFMCMVGIGALLAVQPRDRDRNYWLAALGVLGVGLLSSVSRGPWAGTFVLYVLFLITGKGAFSKLTLTGLAGVVGLAVMSVTEAGQKIVAVLPIIGDGATETFDYRGQLLKNALIVIDRNFWLGSANYLDTAEMQAMIQGEGIIDIVNTYLRVTLETGVVGLSCFVGFFALILLGLFRSFRSLGEKQADDQQVGRALFASLFAALATIATVSFVSFIPYLTWFLAGLSVAYVRIARNQEVGAASQRAADAGERQKLGHTRPGRVPAAPMPEPAAGANRQTPATTPRERLRPASNAPKRPRRPGGGLKV